MTRFLPCVALVLVFGCVAPSSERVPLQPLPENGQVLPYAQLLTRIRAQADRASEAFYRDHWDEVEDMAKGIDQTARFLSKAEDVPEKNRAILKEATGDLSKNAEKLRNAAGAHKVKEATDALQQIIFKVRDPRLTDGSGAQPKKE